MPRAGACTCERDGRCGRLALEGYHADMQEGSVYKVKVVRLMDYGAFVELPNGFQALLHISELANERVIVSECVS